MAFLLDTNILVRLANSGDGMRSVVDHAVTELHRRGETLYITAQNLVEFRHLATRPIAADGLGLSVAEVELKAGEFEAIFPLLPETPDIFPTWKTLVGTFQVIGRQVHDARLVAICHVNKVTHMLTFDVAHMSRLAGFGPGVVVVDPKTC